MLPKNLFEKLPQSLDGEIFEEIVKNDQLTLQRITSRGDVTPGGQWYDQDQSEWVVLLAGAAKLRFENSSDLVELQPGDWLNIPAHKKHRVEWTDPTQATVWLALHYGGTQS